MDAYFNGMGTVDMKSGLTSYQDELLVILSEECGETVQEICKIMRFGAGEKSHHIIGKTHIQCLTQELGDLLAMIELVKDSGVGISNDLLQEAKQKKLEKVVKWMTNTKDE